ncbi:hypothetical protein GKZ90_0002445 [Flavobacterium sp. MC2016-06]|uniref:hypothetical protein n=1 Tax=Flavobacterium sp. MC2016-06 TaxID=2676308 RepID=UPI0012BA7F81|nr:hypothetical protein [Flavobacterium sp. MC2016-06]MBU3858268.1 hypothetical protein [Flavobacterium sp. MC2016-06]
MYCQKSKIMLLLVVSVLMFSCQKEVKTEKKKIKKDTVTAVEPEEEKIILPEEESNFLKRLIKEEIGKQKYDDLQTKYSPYSVHFANDGDPYSVSYSIVKKSDFNNDGVIDYVVDISSEGMLGGNANTNQRFVYYIMINEITPREEHSILGYAPFSYNIIDKANFVGDKFKVDVTQNFRTYSSNVEDLKSTSLSFVYKNDNLYEESYLSDCKLAKLKSKIIFKYIPDVSMRKRSIDMHNYTETIDESYSNNDTLISASLTGCDNLSLSFDTTYKVDSSDMDDADFRKNTSLQFLSFLSKNTLFSKEIDIVANYFSENPITDEYIKKVKGYEFRILIQKDRENKNDLRFLINIDKIDNPYQKENWEIATRQKTAPKEDEEYDD